MNSSSSNMNQPFNFENENKYLKITISSLREKLEKLKIQQQEEIQKTIVGSKNELVRQETPVGPLEVQVTIFELKDNVENLEQK